MVCVRTKGEDSILRSRQVLFDVDVLKAGAESLPTGSLGAEMELCATRPRRGAPGVTRALGEELFLRSHTPPPSSCPLLVRSCT